MKPNFALTLSFEGIGLLHRAFPGWHLVGEIDLDNTDLLGDLRTLRDKAAAIDPSGLRSKLVIPNDQIKYLSFGADGRTPENVPTLVEQKLTGATPYALDDLAYDWVLDKDMVHVAAVARETLREAETFAADHGFNPVSFVASPKAEDFSGEPFFGKTTFASTLCDPDEEVERDPVPVRIIGTAKLPDPHNSETKDTDPPQTVDEAEALETKPDIPEFSHSRRETETVAGFAEPPAPFDDQLTKDDDALDAPAPAEDAAAQADANDTTMTPSFSSIRAVRGDAPETAPKLDGVARHFTPVSVSSDVLSDHLPSDPDEEIHPAEPDPLPTPQAAETLRIPPAPPEFTPAPSGGHSGFATRRSAPVLATDGPRTTRPTAEEEQRMTIFGARDGQLVGGKPKHLALILTAVLLLFLAGVAAWASLFLDDGLARFFQDEPEIITADVPATPEISDAAAPSVAPDGPSEPETAGQATPQTQPEVLTEDAARARYAATGIWQIAPEPPQVLPTDTLDDFYQTSIDGHVAFEDAVALPDLASLTPDLRPDTPGSPAQAGTTFDLDERGLVRATPEGALNPDGLLIFAGQPPVRPAAMPKRVIVEEVLEDRAPQEDPQLAGFKPKTRPSDLAEQTERETLSGRTRDELAALRPKARPDVTREPVPDSVTAEAQTPSTPEPFIDLDAVNGAVAEAVERDPALEDATPQAVASSLKPNTRPRDFAAIVQRSTAAQPQEPTVAVSATQRVTPRIPTATSVARAATDKNVLRLRKINLIGVYGTPNARRALVRMSNGRYRKVKVGDRLDGGKVSAIGASELRYQKSGRNVVLKMPNG